MKTVTVGQLRQNPTAMLADVEAGEVYRITRHDREIGRIVPTGSDTQVIPPKRTGATHLATLPRHELRTAESLDELLADLRGDR